MYATASNERSKCSRELGINKKASLKRKVKNNYKPMNWEPSYEANIDGWQMLPINMCN